MLPWTELSINVIKNGDCQSLVESIDTKTTIIILKYKIIKIVSYSKW